jgi:hypothetical protein
MLETPKKRSRNALGIAVTALLVLAGIGGYWKWRQASIPPPPPPVPESASSVPIKNQPVIDYGQLEKDKALDGLMDERKSSYGVDKGLDMIVKSDEQIRIGDETVDMQDVQRKIQAREGGITQQDIGSAPGSNEYGIYVVQAGDNIWNIHFKLLEEYFSGKNVSLEPMADEPDERGVSSGIGKLLKFSENMVYIYNIKEKTLTTDLNMIQPLSKIVVYNMTRVFALLDRIDYDRVDTIRFDGENIWIPQ